jgi:tetratricopeptide (TPR) repeat protein
VNYVVEGSGQKYGNKFVLRVQLITGKNERHLWGKSYDREIHQTTDIIGVQGEIAQLIAGELKATITPEEKQLIEKTPTANLTAFDFYQRGREEYTKYLINNTNRAVLKKAEGFYRKALKYDSAFAQAYTGLARVYWDKHYWKEYFSGNYMDSVLIFCDIALSFDNKLDEAFTVKGNYYLIKGIRNKAFEYYDKALKINPNSWEAYRGKGYLSWIVDIVETINNYQKAASLYHGSELPNILKQIAEAYFSAGIIEKAKYYYQEAIALNGNKAEYFDGLAWAEFSLENFEEALKLAKKANEIDSIYLGDLMWYSSLSGHNDEAYICAKKLVEYYEKSGELNLQSSHRVGYAFWKAGKIKEAEYYFNQQIKYDEESIKLGRDIAQWKPAQYDLSATYAFLGDKVKAYQYLDEFNKMNFYPLWWVILLKHDPLFTSIHNEERFQKILQNMELKYQAGHERVRKWLEENNMLQICLIR